MASCLYNCDTSWQKNIRNNEDNSCNGGGGGGHAMRGPAAWSMQQGGGPVHAATHVDINFVDFKYDFTIPTSDNILPPFPLLHIHSSYSDFLHTAKC